jgi:hypothetical protein
MEVKRALLIFVKAKELSTIELVIHYPIFIAPTLRVDF